MNDSIHPFSNRNSFSLFFEVGITNSSICFVDVWMEKSLGLSHSKNRNIFRIVVREGNKNFNGKRMKRSWSILCYQESTFKVKIIFHSVIFSSLVITFHSGSCSLMFFNSFMILCLEIKEKDYSASPLIINTFNYNVKTKKVFFKCQLLYFLQISSWNNQLQFSSSSKKHNLRFEYWKYLGFVERTLLSLSWSHIFLSCSDFLTVV